MRPIIGQEAAFPIGPAAANRQPGNRRRPDGSRRSVRFRRFGRRDRRALGGSFRSDIELVHFRHETGATFAAIEAYFATNTPVVVFTTTGPGLTNALTGVLAARGEGAKVILLSACTTAAQRGRWAIQETDNDTMPLGLIAPGALFHMSTVIESVEALPQIFRRIANGLARPSGFVCHLSIPTGLQTLAVTNPMPRLLTAPSPVGPSESVVETCASLLTDGPTAIWVGHGARGAADGVRALAERLGAAVMCSPRAKGFFPEDHPLFVGVTGMGGTMRSVLYEESSAAPDFGARNPLGEPTSFWNPALIPTEGFIHVDIDPDVPGVAYPMAPTLPVCADIDVFVALCCGSFPPQRTPLRPACRDRSPRVSKRPTRAGSGPRR